MALGNKKIMAENIQYYLAKNGKMASDMIRDLEFKTTTVYDWINGRTYPRIDKIEMMANYFGVDKADLIEEHNEAGETIQQLKPVVKSVARKMNDLSPSDMDTIDRMVQAFLAAEKNNDNN